jgi:hypothetical protein
MNLFSVFRSSSVEILFSKRLLAIVYGILAVTVLTHMYATYWQFIGAYYTLHQFDTPIGYVIFGSICMFLPFWAVGALMFRACVQRLRLELWVHQAIKVVAYNTPLRPAEAGFLADYEYTHRELAATLLDLHFRQLITLSIDSSIRITVIPDHVVAAYISPYEQALLTALASTTDSFSAFTDPRLIALAQPAHKVLIDDLVARHMVQPERLPRPGTRKFFRVLYIIAGLVGILNVYALIFQRAETLSIAYPRYVVSFTEPLVLLVVALVVIGIIVSSYWPRFVQNYKDPQYEAWIDAAGFMLYVRTVFTDRFSAKNIMTQDTNTLRMYTPYAVAYGVIPARAEDVSRILTCTTQK